MMRRFTFFCMLAGMLMFTGAMTAQAQGTRNLVTVEIFTGTWCTFCPGSSLGADDLVENGHQVAILEHHYGDNYETTETFARDGYYGVSGYPTSFFDGTIDHVGGNASSSIYSTYLPLYNQAIAVATPFDISMTTSQAGNVITANVTISQVGAYSSGNLVLHLVATESHIPDNWLAGLSEVNFVTRDMVPDQNGTAITVTQGNSVTQTLQVTIDPSWVQDEMHLVAFLQNSSTKQVYNTTDVSLFQPTGQFDVSVLGLLNVPEITCATSMSPELTVRNYGTDAISSLQFSYNVNGGTASTYTWNGSIATGDRHDISLPAINYTPQPQNNTLSVTITQMNGGATEVSTANNSAGGNFDSEAAGGTYTVEIKPDNYGSETTWELRNSSNTVIASGGPYQDNNTQLITQTVNLSSDCFTFTINDSYGDGICCAYGNGYYRIKDPSNNVIASGGEFAASDSRDWGVDLASALEDRLDDEVALYPNPNSGLFTIDLGTNFSNETTVSIHDLSGKQVFGTVTAHQVLKVNVQDLSSGMYMVKINGPEGSAVKRFTKE